jgi:hypothetical protein
MAAYRVYDLTLLMTTQSQKSCYFPLPSLYHQAPGSSPSKWTNPVAPAVTPVTTLLGDLLSPRTNAMVPPRSTTGGRYFTYRIPPGGQQDMYVDMRQNVLMHVAVEEISMRSIKWTACSWAAHREGRDGWDSLHTPK